MPHMYITIVMISYFICMIDLHTLSLSLNTHSPPTSPNAINNERGREKAPPPLIRNIRLHTLDLIKTPHAPLSIHAGLVPNTTPSLSPGEK